MGHKKPKNDLKYFILGANKRRPCNISVKLEALTFTHFMGDVNSW